MSSQPNDQPSGEAVPLPEQQGQPDTMPETQVQPPVSSALNTVNANDPSVGESSSPIDTPTGAMGNISSTNAPYVPRPEVEALTPTTPETISANNSSTTTPSSSINNTMVVVPAPPGAPEGVGGILLSPEAILGDPQMRGMVEDMTGQPPPRPSSRDLFTPETNQPPDSTLLKQLVTNQRLRDLWHQIDALQEEVIQNVRADRTATDAYQQDLLYASTLLLENSANYDESRQIVYRVRGDLMRERKVETDIQRYRTGLILYYVVWMAVAMLLAGADPQFRRLMPDSLPILKLAFPPILFAILGSIVNGMLAIIKHTTTRRDFDPIYLSWYLVNPLIGGLLGLVIFIFFVVTGTSFTPNLITDPNVTQTQAPLAIWILAFIVGWQQNTAVQLLNGFLKTVSPSGQEAAQETRPTGTQSTTQPKPPTSSTP